MQIRMKLMQPAALLGLAAALFLAVPFCRGVLGYPLLYGPESYTSLLMQPVSLYPALLSLLPSEFSALVFQLVLGLGFITGMYLLLRGLKTGLEFLTGLLLVTSPGIIFAFTNLVPDALGLFCLVWGGVFFSRRYHFVSTCFLLMAFAASPWFIVGGLVLIWGYFIAKESPLQYPVFMTVAGILLFALLKFAFVPANLSFAQMLTRGVFELKGPSGYSAIVILFAIIGFFSTYKAYKELAIVYVYCTLSILAMHLYGISPLVLSFLVPVWAAHTIQLLLKKQWVLAPLKHLTLGLVIAGVGVTTILSISSAILANPDSQMVMALGELGRLGSAGSVLTSPDYSSYVEHYSGIPAAPPELAEALFRSRDLKYAKGLLAEQNISAVFISPEMKQGLVWTEPEEGLLFLLRNNQTFRQAYSRGGYEIWEIIG
jgi:hypothetical protein